MFHKFFPLFPVEQPACEVFAAYSVLIATNWPTILPIFRRRPPPPCRYIRKWRNPDRKMHSRSDPWFRLSGPRVASPHGANRSNPPIRPSGRWICPEWPGRVPIESSNRPESRSAIACRQRPRRAQGAAEGLKRRRIHYPPLAPWRRFGLKARVGQSPSRRWLLSRAAYLPISMGHDMSSSATFFCSESSSP